MERHFWRWEEFGEIITARLRDDVHNIRFTFNHRYNFPWWIVIPPYCSTLSFFSLIIFSLIDIPFFPLTSWFLGSPFAVLVGYLVGIPFLILMFVLDLLIMFQCILQTFSLSIAPVLGWFWLIYLIFGAWREINNSLNKFIKVLVLVCICSLSGSIGYLGYILSKIS